MIELLTFIFMKIHVTWYGSGKLLNHTKEFSKIGDIIHGCYVLWVQGNYCYWGQKVSLIKEVCSISNNVSQIFIF